MHNYCINSRIDKCCLFNFGRRSPNFRGTFAECSRDVRRMFAGSSPNVRGTFAERPPNDRRTFGEQKRCEGLRRSMKIYELRRTFGELRGETPMKVQHSILSAFWLSKHFIEEVWLQNWTTTSIFRMQIKNKDKTTNRKPSDIVTWLKNKFRFRSGLNAKNCPFSHQIYAIE
jgi:hypothetical protein